MKSPRNIARHPVGLILVLLTATLTLEPVALAQVDQSWIPTGSLNIPRSGHTATLLPNGKVLIVGGSSVTSNTFNILNNVELYDPTSRSWSITDSLNTPRYLHTATLLANGKVLVVGGLDDSASAELYDPTTGIWSITGSLNTGRFWHTATLLQNGKVLVAAGAGGDNSAELYDPATGKWSITGSLIAARYGQTATLLQNGKVLITAGSDDGDLASTLASAELYDPTTGIWSVTGNLNGSRIFHTATLQPNGKVLVAGGYTPNFVSVGGNTFAASPTSLNGTEVYDPAMGTWSDTASLNTVRNSHTATLLPNGKLLVAGGEYWTIDGNTPNDGTNPCGLTRTCSPKKLNDAELYDMVTGTWGVTGGLNTPRSGHTATPFLNGKILVAGGKGTDGGNLTSAELYESPGGGITVIPSSGNGSFQTFSFSFFDPNGFTNIFSAQLLIHSSLTAAGGCYLYYHRDSHAVWLQNDSGSGWIGPSLLGSGPALQNSQCTVTVAISSASGSDSHLSLNLALGFAPVFSGRKNIYGLANDNQGLTSNWQQTGTWTVP